MNKLTVNGTEYQGVMTPQPLNDSDVAQVLNYVYHSFGNNGFTVSASDVKSVRDTIK
jgi:nitrite reductase (NO-forming)